MDGEIPTDLIEMVLALLSGGSSLAYTPTKP